MTREVPAAEFERRKAAKDTKRKKFKGNSFIGKEDRKRNRRPGVGFAASAYENEDVGERALRLPVSKHV